LPFVTARLTLFVGAGGAGQHQRAGVALNSKNQRK